jgi:hypothetical protein
MTPQTDKERNATLMTALEHCLDMLSHKKLAPKELADVRTLKAYAASLRATLNAEAKGEAGE